MDRVYIIESPSDLDLYEARKEGDALFHSLKLSETDVCYKLVTSKETFERALRFVIEDFYNKSGKWTAMPFIHISAHGDEDGIVLTNGENFDWCDFEELLQEINSKIGFVPHIDPNLSKKISRLVLCFSACKGFNAFKIHSAKEICPYQVIIGPKEDVEWSDALIAFLTFYHHANCKNKGFADSVSLMNIAAGLEEVFDYVLTPEIH